MKARVVMELFGELIKNNISTNEITHIEDQILENFKAPKPETEDHDITKMVMVKKLKDSKRHLKKMRNQEQNERKMIESKYGARSRITRSIMKYARIDILV